MEQHHRTVLVIDDEDSVRQVTSLILEKFGYKPLLAEDGIVGIEMFRAQPEAIACVLLDMTMSRLSGEATFRELRRIRPDARVLLMSGYSEQDATDRFKSKGLAGFLQKPYTPQDLRYQLQQVLEKNGNGKSTGAGRIEN